jgi:hypothetical protein
MKKNRTILLWLLALCLTATNVFAAEHWNINFNGYRGTMEISGSSGRFNLHGSWEKMLDMRVYKNAIFFRRASADQKYLGIIEGDRMSGIFSQGGSGSYPWSAEKADGDQGSTISAPPGNGHSGGNLALKRPARQSSTGYGGNAGRAVDGKRDGNYNAGSVSHTNNAPQEWWEVDLGGQKQIGRIKIFNRTDCCSERLADFYVLVSSRPFRSSSLQSALDDSSIWSYHHQGRVGREVSIPVSADGRYVRIQLAGQNWLSLAEVEVLGADAD